MPHSFPRTARLLTTADFDRVFAARACAADGVLIVYVVGNELGHPRLGLVVSRKVGNAVIRNRWKRVLRAAFRLLQHDLPAYDIVCLPRAGVSASLATADASFRQLVPQAVRALSRREAKTRGT